MIFFLVEQGIKTFVYFMAAYIFILLCDHGSLTLFYFPLKSQFSSCIYIFYLKKKTFFC